MRCRGVYYAVMCAQLRSALLSFFFQMIDFSSFLSASSDDIDVKTDQKRLIKN